jgi:lipid-binding SYLF domain-containing protein
MKTIIRTLIFPLLLLLAFSPAWADDFSDTKKMFKDAGISDMFTSAYGYALFPTIGKGGIVIGGAYGKGRVYGEGKHIGDVDMTQLTAGFQLGGTSFSQVIFFENDAALEKFTSGKFEYGANAQAVAITLSAGATANTGGNAATASTNKNNAVTQGGGYSKGMATFTITKGGLMYEASLGGQKFSYKQL